jgi:hypothetical protein
MSTVRVVDDGPSHRLLLKECVVGERSRQQRLRGGPDLFVIKPVDRQRIKVQLEALQAPEGRA